MKIQSSFSLEHLIDLWHILHRHPELSMQEFQTTRRISEYFSSKGIPFHTFNELTGGYVFIDIGKPKTIGFRADIDALPLTENTGVPFSSKNNGVMHACGHDMHTAIAAGIATILWAKKEQLNSNVVILFQPAEENSPVGGARLIIQSGFLEKLMISEMYALHVWPSYPVGEIALRPGTMMASSDRLTVDIIGKKSHAAEPNLGVDAISIASKIVLGLVYRLRREVDPFDTALISIGNFTCEGAHNIICDHVTLEGTIRAISEETRKFFHRRIHEICTDIAYSWQGSAKAVIGNGYGTVQNNTALFSKFSKYAIKQLGVKKVHVDVLPSLIAEDFSFYGQQIPSLYIHMGCGSKSPLHSPCFLPQEETLEQAIMLLGGYLLTCK
ncbi:MAG: M20 family metallopeptidase [Bacillota bacterium]|nr:M20 family metallopeptidase [Bacillota bacterium]